MFGGFLQEGLCSTTLGVDKGYPFFGKCPHLGYEGFGRGEGGAGKKTD